MKKIFAVLLTATLLFSCQNNKETYVLEGEAQGYADDTKIIIQNFSFKHKKRSPNSIGNNLRFVIKISV